MSFLRIYFAFAAGYLLSYLFRNVNAVISPELARDLDLNPGSLGLLTSAYFVAFALAQIPIGMLLDRFGPRRVEPVLLTIAAAGALAFAFATTLPGLVAARALIGLGVAACLMAPMKALAMWFPGERQASLAGWIMVAGGVGALLATTPVERALHVMSWRAIFVALALATLVAAAWIAWRVPDVPKPVEGKGFAAQWRGVEHVFGHPRFWWLVPVGCAGFGSFMAIQGLWSVQWLIEVDHLTRAEAAQVLLVTSVTVLAGYVALGLFAARLARAGIHTRHLFVAGWTVCGLAFAAIVAHLPLVTLWWSLFGLGAAVNVLAFPVLNEGFSKDLAGRANTAVNLTMFLGTFVIQWGIGLGVDFAIQAWNYDLARALELAFTVLLAGYFAFFALFVAGWRRHARPTPAALTP